MLKSIVNNIPNETGQVIAAVNENGTTVPKRIGRIIHIVAGVPVVVWESFIKCWRYGKPWSYGKPWRYAT